MADHHDPIRAGWEWVVETLKHVAAGLGLGAARTQSGTRGTGSRAEDAAGWYLDRRGYRILERNWWAPARAGEIDIVALKGRTLIAAEVKSFPAGALTASEALPHGKRRKLVSLIKQYARSHGYLDHSLRVDLLTVEWDADGKPGRIEHLQSVATEDA